MFVRWFILMLALLAPAAAGAASPVTLRLELRGNLGAPSWFAMSAPDRIVVDIPGGDAAEAGAAETQGLVRKVRLAQFDPATARAVIHLSGPARVSGARVTRGAVLVTLAPTTVVDFARLPALGRFAAVAPSSSPRAPSAIATIAPLKPRSASAATAGTHRPDPLAALVDDALGPHASAPKPLVMLDPGHGGHDVGAISVHEGRYEKDATLAIARAVKRELEAGGRVRVALTRSDDRFIPLPDRVRIARAAGAALFLSIHCDSAPNPDARGSTVYTLSDVASDALAARAAARENRAGMIQGVELQGEEPEVAGLLYSLVQRGTMNKSADFAQELRAAMGGFRSDAHRFAGFAVLKTGDTPAALLETGYVTNIDDAKWLFSDEGRGALAKGVAAGVERWFARRGPVLAQARPGSVAGAAAGR